MFDEIDAATRDVLDVVPATPYTPRGYHVVHGPVSLDPTPLNGWSRLIYRSTRCLLCLRRFRRAETVPDNHICLACVALAPKCEYCGSADTVKPTAGRTAYDTNKVGWESPNRHVFLCPDCTTEHHEHWDEMWAEANYDRY